MGGELRALKKSRARRILESDCVESFEVETTGDRVVWDKLNRGLGVTVEAVERDL